MTGKRTFGFGPRAGAVLAIVAAVVVVYGRSLGYGLISDDFHWVDGAHHFEVGNLWRLDNRGHFFRPLIEVYFWAAVGVCGQSSDCFHALSLGAHVLTSLLTGLLAAHLSGSRGVGFLAALLLALSSAPVEAVVWVSAVTEVLVTAWFVTTVWLLRVAHTTGRRDAKWLSVVTFTACLLTHESSVALLPVLLIACLIFEPAHQRLSRARDLAPFFALLAGYLVISAIINARNYVVTEGHYALGAHIVRNILDALAKLVVARRDMFGLVFVGVALVSATLWGTARVRFFAMWTVVALIPFAPFHGDLPSRYLYLAATGMACLTAELLWSLRSALHRWPRQGSVIWWLITVTLAVRCGAFATRNVRIGEEQRVPFERYAASVVARHPAPPKGGHLDVPPPPKGVSDHNVQALLRWTYDDYDLTVTISDTFAAPQGVK